MIPELNEQIVKFTPKQTNVQVKLSDFMQVTRIRIKMLVTFGNVTDQIKFLQTNYLTLIVLLLSAI